MNTFQKEWIMKRIALLTILVGLFFGVLSSATVHSQAPYYVSWDANIHYTCTHSAGEYHLLVGLTYLDYYAPNDALASETDITDNSFGHFVTQQDTESDWMNYLGQRKHTTYTVDSASYPITLQAILKTYVNQKEVHESTFTARCTSNSNGALLVFTNNIENPLNFGVWSEGSIGTYHP
jgi:hypothetical protein